MKTSRDIFWYRRDPGARIAALLLLPLSLLYCLAATLRKACYRLGLCSITGFDTPVIVIGNITAGGTGKTPFIIALSQYLHHKGLNPGIVSRGYGGSNTGVHDVQADDATALVGDEPLMIRQQTGFPVVVGKDRVEAVRQLLSSHDCDVVLSDDGLQHLGMGRSMEIVIVDSSRMFGNGLCIPAGPLRETRSRLAGVDLVVYNDTSVSGVDGFSFGLQPGDAVNLVSGECKPIQEFTGRPIHAVAGIGNPLRFFRQLEAEGITVEPHMFPDHHEYCVEDFSGMAGETIIMTRKDAVKCVVMTSSGDIGGVLADAWYLPVDVVLSAQLQSEFEKIASLTTRAAG